MSAPARHLPPAPRLGLDSEFAALRSALQTAGYTEQAVCARLGFERISEFRLGGALHIEREPDDALGLLIHFLMEGAPISASSAARLPLEELRALGLIEPAAEGRLRAAAMLYPLQGLLVASDRTRREEGEAPPTEDLVYPALVPNTEKYLAMLPFSRCDAFLDLCAGTGIAALIAARAGARHSWAFDITERSTCFAKFNQRLNGIENLTAARGDLYEPAGDLTFDRIVAHPPYVPVFHQNMVFDSGGQDGEQIVRGVIEGLPKHLRPGGRFYCALAGTDRERRFELRIRDWLGAAESEFDVAFFVDRALAPSHYVAEAVTRNRASIAEAQPWRELLDRLNVNAIALGFLMVQRRAAPRVVFTVRRNTGPKTGLAETHWLMDWETFAASDSEALLRLKLRARTGIGLRVEHRLADGQWSPFSYRLRTDYPFEVEIAVHPWAGHFLGYANGERTIAEILQLLREAGAVHPDTPLPEFGQGVAQLVSGGFLETRPLTSPAAE